jgi:hypothetical protein
MDARELHTASMIDGSPYNRGVSGAEWVSRPGNQSVVFRNGDTVLFEDAGDKTFNVHWLFEDAHGKQAIAQARIAFNQAFDVHGALALTGLTPVENRAARIFNRWMGGKSLGIIETPFGPCEKFLLTRQMWKAN